MESVLISILKVAIYIKFKIKLALFTVSNSAVSSKLL